MTGRTSAFVVLWAALVVANVERAPAQMTYHPAAPPIVTAENEVWYLQGEPITFSGSLYYPAGPQVYFNGYDMVRTGGYRGVPLFQRRSIEPYSRVYVPLAGGLMQPYERRREGELAGTVGSTLPAFPVQTASEQYWLETAAPGVGQAAGPPTFAGPVSQWPFDYGYPVTVAQPQPAATTGTVEPEPARPPAGPLATAKLPEGLNGIFIQYDGRRWFSSGAAVEFDAARFTRIGEYHGFNVYADQSGAGDAVYVAVSADTPTLIAPYATRR
ncbi:MAG TPA: hypothetical protein VD833_20885 [Vicinamibacterales bacterium]|nr:hypothetical protein [Vicinamibacterales bacterium]